MFHRNRRLVPCFRSQARTGRNIVIVFATLNSVFFIYLITNSADMTPGAVNDMQVIVRKEVQLEEISRGHPVKASHWHQASAQRQQMVNISRPGKLNIRNERWSSMNESLRGHLARVQEVLFGGDPWARDPDPTGGCHNLEPAPEGLPDGPSWHFVTDSRDHLMFSAYLETRTRPWAVNVLGFSATSGRNHFCQIWYRHRPRPYVSSARYQIIPETHGLRYGASVFTCSTSLTEIPYAVSVSPSKCGPPSHYLTVHVSQGPEQTPRRRFTVCVSSPLNFHYDDVHSLVEYMELNRILGAERVVLYNHTSGPAVDVYLRQYVSEGFLDVIPWRIPLVVNEHPPDSRVLPQVHYFGQVAALNDCLYRYMYSSEYLVFTDLDEFIVPRQSLDWAGMLANIRPGPKHSALMFRNTFFRLDWQDDSAYDHVVDRELGLRTQLKLNREVRVWDYFSRTKYMIAPAAVSVLGIHFVFEFVEPSERHLQVSTEVGLLHHYRDWGDEEGRPERVLDSYMVKWRKSLQQAAIRVHNTTNHTRHRAL